METHCTQRVCAYGVLLMIAVGSLSAAQRVYSSGGLQEYPDVDNGVIVWTEWVQNSNWDIYGVDLFNTAIDLINIAIDENTNQDMPAIWYDRVVYQDDSFGDWDVKVADISDANILAPNYLITDYSEDQINPVIHGNTVVWQDYVVYDGGEDWDIYAADITDPNNAWVFVVDEYINNQQAPAVYRNRVVYLDDPNVNTDIWSADMWLKDIPQYETVIANDTHNQTAPAVWGDIVVYEHEISGTDVDIYARDMSQPDSEPFLISGGISLQLDPDISGHIIVWQDNRNTNWDIYGYNLITKKEFQITTDGNDQTQPAISGPLVVWKDARDNPANIYYTWLDTADAADCPSPLIGDANGDCRVNLVDFALMADQWLSCALDPITACTN